MTKSSTRSAPRASTSAPSIVLKIVHDEILKANPTSTLTTKQMRVKLRATPKMQEIHTRNASWIFTQSQADAVRAMFDPAFAQRQANAQKRATKKAPVASTPATSDAGE